jgi:hypothetical protein
MSIVPECQLAFGPEMREGRCRVSKNISNTAGRGRDAFLSKYRFIFMERDGKEKEEELIAQFLKEYINRGFGLCKN